MMTKALSLLLSATLAQAAAAAPTATYTAPFVVPLKLANGASGGRVTLVDAPGGVLLKVDATGLTPGWHAIHFHEKADCGDAAFKAAGAHAHAALPAVHGLMNPQANDAGDLPNIHAGDDGRAMAELFSPLVALRSNTPRVGLLDADGSAIVIHAKADDHVSQPIGGAGDRIACGVMK